MEGMGKKHKRGDAPYSITDAQEAASLEARHRIRAYSVKMTMRVICFPLGAWLAHSVNFWLGIGLVLFATVIPWFAVVAANAIKPADGEGGHWASAPGPAELTEGDQTAPSDADETIHTHSTQHAAATQARASDGADQQNGADQPNNGAQEAQEVSAEDSARPQEGN